MRDKSSPCSSFGNGDSPLWHKPSETDGNAQRFQGSVSKSYANIKSFFITFCMNHVIDTLNVSEALRQKPNCAFATGGRASGFRVWQTATYGPRAAAIRALMRCAPTAGRFCPVDASHPSRAADSTRRRFSRARSPARQAVIRCAQGAGGCRRRLVYHDYPFRMMALRRKVCGHG